MGFLTDFIAAYAKKREYHLPRAEREKIAKRRERRDEDRKRRNEAHKEKRRQEHGICEEVDCDEPRRYHVRLGKKPDRKAAKKDVQEKIKKERIYSKFCETREEMPTCPLCLYED